MRGVGAVAAEPQGPHRFSPSKPAPGATRKRRRWAVAACIAIQLIAVVAVYQAHAHFVGEPAGGRRQLEASEGGSSAPRDPSCTVRLEEAGEGVVRREVEAIVRSLTGEAAWTLGSTELESPEEGGDKARQGPRS